MLDGLHAGLGLGPYGVVEGDTWLVAHVVFPQIVLDAGLMGGQGEVGLDIRTVWPSLQRGKPCDCGGGW
jgi:hypothetical protein